MSAAFVRASFRAKLAPLLTPDGFVFVESVNLAPSTKELPSNWYTLEFIPSDDVRAALGVPTRFRETGVVLVAVFTPQQTEDTSAIGAAEIIRAALCNWTEHDDNAGDIRVLDAQPPQDLDAGDFRGSFYGATVSLRYQYDRMA